MPARRDIDPVGSIPHLIASLLIVERAGDQFRARLAGSAVASELGYDPTGRLIGPSIPDPKAAADANAIFERVFTTTSPVFATGEFVLKPRVHPLSLLALPLSDDEKCVNMVLCSFVACFHRFPRPRDWLKDAPVKVCDVKSLQGPDDLKKLCLEWEERCNGTLSK
jgi:hypothetical protein